MKNYDEIIATIKNYDAFKGEILLNEPLANKSTFKVGGTADLFIRPINYYSFQIVLSVLLEAKAKFFILGGGSNIVFPDDEYKELLGYIEEQIEKDMQYNLSAASIIKSIVNDLPTQAQAAMDIVNNFDKSKFQAVVDFATAANGGRPIDFSKENL